MRMNIYYSLLLMILLSVASIGCSDNNVEWESDEVPSDKITLDIQGTLDLLHNESVVVKIMTGNGSYQVDSQDKDIAEAEVPEKIAFKYRVKDDIIKEIKYAEFIRDVNAVGSALCELGVVGEHIAQIGENSYRWINVYLTIHILSL